LVRKYVYNGFAVTAVRHDRVPIDIHIGVDDPAILEFASGFLREGAYELLHIAHPMRLSSFATAAAQLEIPYVITLTDFWVMCPKINLRTSFDTLCAGPDAGQACSRLCPELGQEFVTTRLHGMRTTLARARAVACPSRFVADLVEKEFPEIKVTVVPHGLTLQDCRPKEREYKKESRVTFAYCGGLSSHKGVHVLVNAFRSLRSENAELRIYGAAGSHEKEYERSLRAMAAPDQRIKFCGTYAQQDVGSVFCGIDALVIPSLCYESYSFTLHEALASNVPVIASAIGSLDEEIKDSFNGLLFPVGDETALAGRLKEVMEAPAILTTLKNNMQTLLCPLEEEEAYSYEMLYRTGASQLNI